MSSPHDRPPAPDAPPERTLSYAELQRWFLERIVSPHRTAGATVHVRPPDRADDDVIRPSRSLTPTQRIDIYSELYFIRLRNILAKDYLTVEWLAGERVFNELARDYFSRFPANDFTLRPIGASFPYHVRHHSGHDCAAMLADVARLEYAMTEACDTPDLGRVTAEVIGTVPVEMWPAVRFRMEPSFRILALEYDASRLIDDRQADVDQPDLSPRPSYAVVWRRDGTVWRQSVSRPMYEILSAFVAGHTVAEALDRAASVWDGDDDELAAKIFEWFADWLNEGFFRDIIIPSENSAARSGPAGEDS